VSFLYFSGNRSIWQKCESRGCTYPRLYNKYSWMLKLFISRTPPGVDEEIYFSPLLFHLLYVLSMRVVHNLVMMCGNRQCKRYFLGFNQLPNLVAFQTYGPGHEITDSILVKQVGRGLFHFATLDKMTVTKSITMAQCLFNIPSLMNSMT
jgi:hypothetical protein